MAIAPEIAPPQVDDRPEQGDPVEQYYNYLKQAGADVAPSLDSFKRTLSDSSKAQQYYNYLRQNNFDTPGTFDSFERTLGVKKNAASSAIPKVDYSSVPTMKHVSESTSAPAAQPPAVVPTKTRAQLFEEKNQQATQTIQQELKGNDELIPSLVKSQKQQADYLNRMAAEASRQKAEKPLTSVERLNEQLHTALAHDVPIDDQDIQGFRQNLTDNEDAARGFLAHIVNQKPEKALDIKTAMATADGAHILDVTNKKEQGTGQVLNNLQGLSDGKLDYDVKRAQWLKPEDPWESVQTGLKNKNKAFADYDLFSNATPDKAIAELEKRRNEYDPLEPVPVSKNILSSITGGLASQPIPGLIAGKIAGGATLLIPGAQEFAPAADNLVAMAWSGNDFRKMAYSNYLQQHYNELRNNGVTPELAYAQAQDVARKESLVDAISGAAMMGVGGQIAKLKLPKFSLSEGFTNAVVSGLKQSAKGIGEATAVGLIQGQAQEIKNKIAEQSGLSVDHTGRDISEAIKSGALFTLGIATIAKGFDGISGITKNRILQGLAKADPQKVQEELGRQISDGSLTPAEAKGANEAIDEHRQAQESLPSRIKPETALKILDKIDQRKELEKQLETKDKAYHPALKEKIKAINEDILELSKDKMPRGEKDVLDTKQEEDVSQEDVPRGNIENEIVEPSAHQSGDLVTSPHFEGPQKIQSISPDGQSVFMEGEYDHHVHEVPIGEIKPMEGITPNSAFRTLDYGDNKGLDETPARQDKIKEEILNNEPIGKTGESFDNFVFRVLTGFKKLLRTADHNTVLVTHSSVIKALRVWEEMGRPNLSDLSKTVIKDFAQKYVDLKPEGEGKVNTFKGANGNDIKVVRHGETEDNVASEFRQDNTRLTDKGKAQGQKAGQNILKETGGNVPNIISSDLPRALHTSQLIHDILNPKTSDNAEAIRSDTGQISERGSATEGGEDTRGQNLQRNQVEASEHGQTVEQAGKQTPNDSLNEPPAEPPSEELPFGKLPVGISHESQVVRRLAELGVEGPERGEGVGVAESIEHGKNLLEKGTDPEKIAEDFKKDPEKKISYDGISAVRARYNELAKSYDEATDKYGEKSPQATEAANKEATWLSQVVKPMQTEWHKIGQAQQGRVDLDTGSVSAIKRAKAEATGRPQEALPEHIKELSDKVKSLEDNSKKLQQKLQDALQNKKTLTKPERQRLSSKLTDLAKTIRTSAEFDNFLKGAGDDVKKMGVELPRLKEIAASILEDAAKAVKAGEDAADFIKDAVGKLKEDIDKDKFVEALQEIGKKTGLFEVKETPEEEDRIKQEKYESLVKRFEGKRDNVFTAEDSADIWQYAKENYIDNNPNFNVVDMVNKVATDFGLSSEQVRNALGGTKETKPITDQLYRNQYEKNKASATIQRWVSKPKDSAVTKLLDTIASPFRGLATLGHGHALLFTHAGMNLFDPQIAKNFFQLSAKQFKIVYGKPHLFEQAKSDLKGNKLFTTAIRAGLGVDPDTIYDDWQIANTFLKKMKIQGNKGFLVLKMMRMKIFENEYNKLSDVEKADKEAVKRVATIANHWTGTAGIKVSPVSNAFIFAPNLIASKFARLTSDPLSAINTYRKWGSADLEDKVAARIIVRKTARTMAMYMAALAGNQALLALAGSNSSVNFTNPFQPDWLKFKAGDKTVDVSSGMASTMQFLTQLGALPFEGKAGLKENYHTSAPGDALKNELTGFLRKSLSPFGSTVWDQLSHKDYSGNVLPWFSDKPGKGKDQLSVAEYVSEKLPIPVAEAIKDMHDQMKENGASELSIDYLIGGIILGGVASAGVKISSKQKSQGGSTDGGGAGSKWNIVEYK